MADWKSKAAVVMGTAGIVLGGLSALGPQDLKDNRPNQTVEQQLNDLADSHERTTEGHRDKGMDGLDMENQEKLKPGERRMPPIRIRWP